MTSGPRAKHRFLLKLFCLHVDREYLIYLLIICEVNRSEFSYEIVLLTRKVQLKTSLSLWKKNAS